MDCSKMINFFSELKRLCASRIMCKAYAHGEQCPLYCSLCELPYSKICAEDVKTAIENLQKWSDEHPRKTYAQDLFKKLPNAMRRDDGTPFDACRKALYGTKCPIENEEVDCDNGCDENRCVGCWNEEMEV